MAKYHVSYTMTGIFAGIVNKNKTAWVHKSNVTDEAVRSVAQYLLERDISFNFTYHGKNYKLKVEETKGE